MIRDFNRAVRLPYWQLQDELLQAAGTIPENTPSTGCRWLDLTTSTIMHNTNVRR